MVIVILKVRIVGGSKSLLYSHVLFDHFPDFDEPLPPIIPATQLVKIYLP